MLTMQLPETNTYLLLISIGLHIILKQTKQDVKLTQMRLTQIRSHPLSPIAGHFPKWPFGLCSPIKGFYVSPTIFPRFHSPIQNFNTRRSTIQIRKT